MDSVLARLGYRKRAPALFAMSAWSAAVGETVARHAMPERVEHDVLHVVVDGAPWANELRWMEGALVAQLNAACGRQAVARLRFRIGTLPAAPGEGPLPTRVRMVPSAAADEVAGHMAEAIRDPDLARAWRKLVARGLDRDVAVATSDEADGARKGDPA